MVDRKTIFWELVSARNLLTFGKFRGILVSLQLIHWTVICQAKWLWMDYGKNETIKLLLSVYISSNVAAAAKSLQSCPTLRPHRQEPIRLPRPRDSPGKNTGVDCHVLLQCMKVKSESEVTHSCPTHHDPMDCSPPGSSVHGIFQARVLEWGAIGFSQPRIEKSLHLYTWN